MIAFATSKTSKVVLFFRQLHHTQMPANCFFGYKNKMADCCCFWSKTKQGIEKNWKEYYIIAIDNLHVNRLILLIKISKIAKFGYEML